MISINDEIFKRFGTVQRARGCFLYTKKGVRLTDLYCEGGRAILGWGSSSAFTMFKDVLSRGLTGSFKTESDGRLTKAVSELFGSERIVFTYNSLSKALKAAISYSRDGITIWKPWRNKEEFAASKGSLPCVIFAPPLPWTDSIYVLAVDPSLKDKPVDNPETIRPVQDCLNAPLKTALTRSIYNLIKAQKEMKESDWFIYDTYLIPYFERKGPYLFPKVPEEKYEEFVLHCLDCNLVISPNYNTPSIVPFGADKGVFSLLKKNPFSF